MEFRQIECFLTVAELLSFRAAAARLGLRQPSVSQRINALENELGVTLFERHAGRGVRLTAAGSRFLRDARRIVGETNRALENARRAGRAEIGDFALGFMTSLAHPRLHATLEQYREGFPDVEIRLVEGNTADLTAALLDHRVHLAILADDVRNPRIESIPLWSERLYAAIPARSSLVHANRIDWSTLADSPILVRTSENAAPGYEFLKSRIPAGRRPVEIQRHLVGRDNLIALAAAGFGVAVVAEPLPGLGHPGVVFRPLVAADAFLPINASWLADSENPAAGRFLTMLRQSAAAATQVTPPRLDHRRNGPSAPVQTSDQSS